MRFPLQYPSRVSTFYSTPVGRVSFSYLSVFFSFFSLSFFYPHFFFSLSLFPFLIQTNKIRRPYPIMSAFFYSPIYCLVATIMMRNVDRFLFWYTKREAFAPRETSTSYRVQQYLLTFASYVLMEFSTYAMFGASAANAWGFVGSGPRPV